MNRLLELAFLEDDDVPSPGDVDLNGDLLARARRLARAIGRCEDGIEPESQLDEVFTLLRVAGA